MKQAKTNSGHQRTQETRKMLAMQDKSTKACWMLVVSRTGTRRVDRLGDWGSETVTRKKRFEEVAECLLPGWRCGRDGMWTPGGTILHCSRAPVTGCGAYQWLSLPDGPLRSTAKPLEPPLCPLQQPHQISLLPLSTTFSKGEHHVKGLLQTVF